MKKKNGVKIIQTAGYNGARTVIQNFPNYTLKWQKWKWIKTVSGIHVSGGLPIVSLDSKSQCALHREQANKGHVSIQAKSSHLTQQFIWLRSIKLQHKDRFSRNTLSKKLPSFSLHTTCRLNIIFEQLHEPQV